MLLRSDDEAQTWHYYRAIENDRTLRFRADLVQVGRDVAMVYAYESSRIEGSTDRDVYFQWWRFDPATRDFVPQPPVRVFDSTSSSTAYYRGELAVDSQGRLWVHASLLEANGTFSLVMSVSSDGGRTFVRQPDLDNLRARAGGRLLSL
ncbi:MAG: exo-alpha-sialidase, partial [Myxococcales bacterium]